jgi:hypothetical protein
MNYLDNEISDKLFVLSFIMTEFANHFVLSFLIELFNESIYSSHLLDSGSILLSRLLNSKFDLILLQFCFVILHQSLLFICNILFLFYCELVISLFHNSLNSFISMWSDEVYHRLENFSCFLIVHILLANKICYLLLLIIFNI